MIDNSIRLIGMCERKIEGGGLKSSGGFCVAGFDISNPVGVGNDRLTLKSKK
jgi:hypothetical protein